jgi:hypothetical protein
MMSLSYLIGPWSCEHTVGTFSGRYTTTYSKALGDRWLREIWDFPARNAGNGNEGAVTAEALMGFDERRQAWIRFFANSLGQHFEIRMTDTPNGWSFKYASFFPLARPETPKPDATFTKANIRLTARPTRKAQRQSQNITHAIKSESDARTAKAAVGFSRRRDLPRKAAGA